MRQALAIAPGAMVFLTVGSAFKYTPIGDLDFPAVAARLLDRLPEAYLVAVGPLAKGREWREHIRRLHPRMRVVGPQRGIETYYAAADIYLEGFPFDSATAVLEAALSGLPVVPVPATAPLPFSAHGGPKAAIPQPATVADYLDEALRLAGSAELRRDRTDSLCRAVVAACTGGGWGERLAQMIEAIPAQHRTYDVGDDALDPALDRFLARLQISRQSLPRLVARMLYEGYIRP